jgi:probable rRNA maturation factor
MMNDNFTADTAAAPEGGETPVYRLEAEILTQGSDGISFDFDAEEVAQQVCEAVLASEECPYDAGVYLMVTDEEEVHRMNLDYRGIDRTTDVLSFPAVPFEAESDFSAVEENEMDYIDPDTGFLQLGDIVINASRVWEQAREYGHSPRREFAFLVAHSMLHLFGFDHMEEDERLIMEEKQREIMDLTGLKR